MKVNAINNTNFKGLFVNKAAENGGNWRMEYHPYSWETKLKKYSYWERIPGMSEQTDIDVKAQDLPDNEKIYRTSDNLQRTIYPRGKESCRDILGTEFYLCDYDKNITRKTITEMPAMTLEDSLRVKIKKLGNFLEMKDEHRKKLESDLAAHKTEIDSKNKDFENASREYDKSWSARAKSKDSYKYDMDQAYDDAKWRVYTTFKDMKEYFEFNDSIKSVVDLRQKLTEEVDKLTNARTEGSLIDISRRDIYDPNKALWEALHNLNAAAGKLVALPHKTISVQDILKAIGGKVKNADIPQKAVKYIDELIAHRL